MNNLHKAFPFAVLSILSYGQGSMDYENGLKINLNPEGLKFIRFIAWNQIWLRNTSLNPGTMIADESTENAWSVGNRRLRLLAYAQISKRYMIVTHIGINNQTFTNGGSIGTSGTGGYGAGKKPALFFHDAWNEYALFLPSDEKKFTASIGAGLHYYMGLSRYTMSSTLNYLTLDAPIFNWPLIENSDQFARQIGVFAKGKYGKLEYRLSINKPFATNLIPSNSLSPDRAIAVDNNGNPNLSKAGYFEYQFLDQESNLLPFKVGTYLGTKKVFNMGAGFYHQKKGTRSMVNNTTSSHDIRLLSVDAFADIPIGAPHKKMALTAYAVYYNYNFGPNYLRNIGIMNVGIRDPDFNGNRAIAGPGNLQPSIGTGTIAHVQAGVLLPNQNKTPKLRIQPYLGYTHKNFQALKTASNQLDIGANWLIDGHHAKITTQYSTRPTYLSENARPKMKGEFLVQFQIYL